MTVPQDWDDPAAGELRLRVAVSPAVGPDRAPDPLVHLAGFGGAAATDDGAWAARVFAAVNKPRDLVFVDQRGTGRSSRLTCPGLVPASTSAPELDALRAGVRRCLDSVARDPRHDTTVAAVRDLDRVLTALGYHRVNLYGGSYGVSLGLAYLQRYPDRVRTAVFDGYLATPETAALLPADLATLVDGDRAGVLAARFGADAAAASSAPPTQLQEVTIRCSDAWATIDPAAVEAQAGRSLFTPAVARTAAWQRALCAVRPHDAGVSGIVTASTPVTFLNGELDPADPPANVADAPATMAHAPIVTVPGGRHGTIDDRCLRAQASAFVDRGDAPERETWRTCTDRGTDDRTQRTRR